MKGLKLDKTVVTWGGNNYGQLGDGTTKNRLSPVNVAGLNNASSVTTGCVHTLAVSSTGPVMGWGNNYYGQLGDGTKTNRLSPIEVPETTAMAIVSAEAGVYHNVAVKNDNSLVVWGNNFYGQLGDGSTFNRDGVTVINPTIINNPDTTPTTKQDQSLSFDFIESTNNCADKFSFSVNSSAALPVRLSSDTPSVCSVDSSGKGICIKSGACTIVANQDGNNQYNAARKIKTTFQITKKAIYY